MKLVIKALEAGGIPPKPPTGATLAIGTWYSEMGKFASLAAMGFSHVHEWSYPAQGILGFLDAAHAHGLKAYLELSWAMENNHFYPDRLNDMMCQEYIDHPAFVGWLPYDEPDLRQTPVGEMQKIYDAIRQRDPHHDIKLTIRYPWKSTGQPYLPFGKTISVDPYPIQYGPAEQAGSETREAVASEGLNGKPMWTDLQTFAWENVFVPPEPYGRMPTLEEIEIMGTTSIQAQTHQNKGLYCYLEDELMQYQNGLGNVVAKWRALVPGAQKAPAKVVPTGLWPSPRHREIDAFKKLFREEKRRRGFYPFPRS